MDRLRYKVRLEAGTQDLIELIAENQGANPKDIQAEVLHRLSSITLEVQESRTALRQRGIEHYHRIRLR